MKSKSNNISIAIIIFLVLLGVICNADKDWNTLFGVLLMEAFVSIHMSAFVLSPLSKIFAKGDSKKLFWKFFWIRVGVLVFCDFFVTPFVAVIDFFLVFIGAFIVVPIVNAVARKKGIANNVSSSETIIITNFPNDEITTLDNIKKCNKCSSLIKEGYKFCENCGEKVEVINNELGKVFVKTESFDAIYRFPESKMVEEFILREMKNCDIDEKTALIPKSVEMKKIFLNTMFSVLLFIYISLIFFHFPLPVYIVGLIILIIFYIIKNKYSLIKFLVKEVKSRPQEKISNVVMSVKQTLKVDKSKIVGVTGICLSVLLSLLIFIKPHIMYEKMDNGYGVRFYTFGLTNFTSATIPNTYKGENVVSLRGNTFSNMFFLKEVNLADTITEIRGQAFYNAINLEKVNIPNSLEYLGGGAFYNAKKITNISLPESLTYIGGEAFYNATSLESINLPSGLSEIRGNTFENCKSLVEINIPDNVTRIGGHAFYGCSSLSSVIISQNSKLNEIGSSAFRLCHSLYNITLPHGVYVNERAFKESPTVVSYYGEYSNYYNYNNY